MLEVYLEVIVDNPFINLCTQLPRKLIRRIEKGDMTLEKLKRQGASMDKLYSQ